MGKTFETIINRFDGGLVNDPRERVSNSSALCRNFDISTNPNKLTPYKASEDGDSAAATSRKQNFAMALWTGTGSWRLFGLGVKSGGGLAEVLMKDITIGGSADLGDNTWVTPANNQSGSTTSSMNLFTYYHKTALIYGARAGTHIWAYSPAAAAWADTSHALTYTNIGEGLVHSKDDILYIPYDNKIAKNNDGSWTDAAITIPDHLKISSICEYGNYIAIAATPLSTVGKTFVYLWNRDSTLTTLSESIEWGTGKLQVLEEVEGYLIGISLYGGTDVRNNDRIVFRAYAGGTPKIFMTLQADSSSNTLLTSSKEKIDERLYFMMKFTKDGVVREGVWSIYLENDKFAITHESTPDNDTELTTGIVRGFVKVGDYLFQSFQDNGVFKLTKTDNTPTYTHSSIYQTNVNPNIPTDMMSRKKQLVAVSLSTEAMSHRSEVKLEYRVDGGSWVEVFTSRAASDGSATEIANVGQINNEAVIDVNGAQFQDGREYEFKLTSGGFASATSGAEITEFKYKWALLDTQI